jgi:hypothetical protein
MRLFFIGDIVGGPGRNAVRKLLNKIKDENNIDIILANGENASGGFGVTPKNAKELLECGIDVITSGNHIWDKKEIIDFFSSEKRILRPANYPEDIPGNGWILINTKYSKKVGIISLVGRVFMKNIDCPFRASLREINKLSGETNIIIVDFHAEATSEKIAMGWFLDGKVSAVIGTHTHVQTADERILPNGTAYISDVGMTGAMDSVIGVDKDIIIEKFLTCLPKRFQVAKRDIRLNGVIIDIDPETGKSTRIKRIVVPLEEHQ